VSPPAPPVREVAVDAGPPVVAVVEPPVVVDAGPPLAAAPSPARPALVSIDAAPWGQVTLDGKPRGDTPVVELKVPPGEHTLRVTNPETGKSSTQKLVLRSGEVRAVRVDLR
ncbi:MAG: PEGA domain-containing protein, partial [Myxococcota bacterium]